MTRGNSACNGPHTNGESASGASPASRIITGERLGSEHWWYLI